MAIYCDHSGEVIPSHEYQGPTHFVWEGTEYQFDLSTGSAREFEAAQEAHREAVEDMKAFAALARPVTDPLLDTGTSEATPDAPAPVPEPKPKRARKPVAKVAKRASLRGHAGTGNSGGAKVQTVAMTVATPDAATGSSNGDTTKADPKEVRAWAAEMGIVLSARGRIPADVVNAYQAR